MPCRSQFDYARCTTGWLRRDAGHCLRQKFSSRVDRRANKCRIKYCAIDGHTGRQCDFGPASIRLHDQSID
jgi:hypothetical protein